MLTKKRQQYCSQNFFWIIVASCFQDFSFDFERSFFVLLVFIHCRTLIILIKQLWESDLPISFKWAIPGLFSLLFVFSMLFTLGSTQIFKIFAYDWFQTVNLWCWKQPLCQLSHNHCPTCLSFCEDTMTQLNNSRKLTKVWFSFSSNWSKIGTEIQVSIECISLTKIKEILAAGERSSLRERKACFCPSGKLLCLWTYKTRET